MRIDIEEGVVVYDNLLEGDREFGAKSTTVRLPAEPAVVENAIGTFSERTLDQTHNMAVKFGERIKKEFGEAPA